MGGTRAKLEALGIEALGITEDSAEPVRSYYRIRPSKLRLATDPKRDVHRRYGLPMPSYAGAYTQLREATLTNPTGELPAPMPIPAGMKVLDEKDGLPTLPEAKAVMDAFAKRDYAMHVGHFLVDRSGVVRWTWIESPSPEDISQYGRFPTNDEILAAVRAAGVRLQSAPEAHRLRRRITARRGPVSARTSSPKSYKIIAVSLYSDQANALDEAVRKLASAGYPKPSRSLIVQTAVERLREDLSGRTRKSCCAISGNDICADH